MNDDDPKAVPADAVREASGTMLQKQLYAIFTTPTGGLNAIFATMEDHLSFQVALEADGTLFAAGPLWTDDEAHWEGEGLIVVRAASLAEARAIAERDPMHVSGARTFIVRPWMINEGSMRLRLDYSSQTFELI